MKTVSRKEFLKSAAMLSAGGVLAAGSFASAEKSLCSYADTIAWDGVYDVVVMGMGAAGCSAATYAAKAGAGVLLFDVAPEWEAGGNSRYCAQFCFIALDKEGVLEKANELKERLSANWRVKLDDSDNSPGRKAPDFHGNICAFQ